MVSFYQPAQQCECRWRWPVMWQDECHPGLGCSLPPPRFGTKPCRVSWWPPEGDRWHCTKINQLLWCWVTNELVTTSGVIKEVQQRTGLNVQQEEWKCTSPLYKKKQHIFNNTTRAIVYLFIWAVCCYHGNWVSTLRCQFMGWDGYGCAFLGYHGDCASHSL